MEKSAPTTDLPEVRESGGGNVSQDLPAKDSGRLLTADKKDRPRTLGLKLFDVFLYPIVTNLSVFGISVAATYLTNRGADVNKEGKLLYGKFGKFIHDRGIWLVKKFKDFGMSDGQADMSKMVFFSFLDGSLMAPVVKLIEDRREDIGCYIDRKLGTKPEDLSVYDKEPKQSWFSVLGGRLATVAVVVPTAVALDKTGLNDTLFNNPGKKVGAWLEKKPRIVKIKGRFDLKELSRIGFFEAFYTSVCTTGLYVASRGLARLTNKKLHAHHHLDDHSHADAPAIATVALPEIAPEAPPSGIKAHEELKRPRAVNKIPGTHRDKYTEEAASAPSLSY